MCINRLHRKLELVGNKQKKCPQLIVEGGLNVFTTE
jgi:hypothetical protein